MTIGTAPRRRLFAFLMMLVALAATPAYGQCPVPEPVKLSPADGSEKVALNVTLRWSIASAPETLYVYVKADSEPLPGKDPYVAKLDGRETSFQDPKPLKEGTLYYWLVVAETSKCSPSTKESVTQRFTTLTCVNPKNSLPKDGAVDVAPKPTLEWSSAGASLYEVYASIDGAAEKYLGKSSTTQFSDFTFPEGSSASWRVKAVTTNGCGDRFSQVTRFTVLKCSSPNNVFPKDGETNVSSSPTLEWSAVPSVSVYEVYATVGSGTESYLGKTASTQFTPTSPFPEGATVKWRVKAVTSNGCGDRFSGATGFTVISCKFAAPEQVGPADGSTQPVSVKFSWKAVSGAGDYGLLTSVDGAGFKEERVGNVTGVERSFSNDVKVTWFVNVYPANGCDPVRSTSDFTFLTEKACPTGAPRLLEPGDGVSGVVSPVTFKWESVAGVESYELFTAEKGSSTFVSLGKTTATDLSRSVSGVVQWYVESIFPGSCPRGKSVTAKFEVESIVCPKEGAKLVAPLDGASVTSPVVFEWGAVTGAQKYSLEARKAGSTEAFSELVTTTALKAEVKLSVGELEWRVVAFPDKCDAVVSATRRVAVKESTTCGSNKPPGLVSPPDGEIFETDVIKFVWTLVEGASSYDLQISLDDGGSWKTLGSTKEEGIVVTVPEGKFLWRALAQFSGCPAVASLPRSIQVVISKCPSIVPTIVAPTLGSTVASPVLLQWSAVTGTDFYRVFASIDGSAASNISGSVTETSFEAALPAGTIVWYVEAVSRTCGSAFSDKSKFVVEKVATCPTAGPKLLSPANGASGVPRLVQFSWEAVPGAVSYEVFVSIDGGAPISLGVTKELTLERELKGEKLTWYVLATTPGCDPVSSDRASFALAPDESCTIAAPSRILPTENFSGVSPVVFQWTSSGAGTYYRLWVTRDGDPEVVLAETLDTSVERHLDPGSYGWFVEAFRKGCSLSAKSTKGRFAVVKSQSCPTDASAPLSPADGATLASPDVTFNWSPVTGAIAYELWLARGDGVETLVRVTKLTSETVGLPEGKMSWFVRALFDGCPPTRSQALTFAIELPDACKGQPQFLLTPPIDEPAELSNPVFFSWTAATGGSGSPSYSVLASVDDADPISVGLTDGTSITSTLPAGRVSWFVRATRPGCPTVDSSRGVFVVASPEQCGEPKSPLIRAVLEAVSGKPFTIGWLPGANTSAFLVEESPDPMFAVVESKIVSDPYASFVHEVAVPTPFYYRVIAVSDCNEKQSLPSETVRVVVTPKQASADSKVDNVHPLGTTGQLEIPIRIGGSAGKSTSATTFTAATTQPWMTVSPSSGTIPPDGITLVVTAETGQLGPGANTGSLVLTTTDSLTGKTTSSGSTTTPVSVSLVSPVSPTSKSGPKPESLIIPAVGHAAGLNSQWQSDVRLSNISAQPVNYLLFFTPSGQAGTGTVKQASVTVSPGSTVALDDVVKSWFGIGADGASATGQLEIRPQSNAITTTSSSSLANGSSLLAGTVASSRTYNLSSSGTFGQFVPAVAYARFAGKGEPLSLQQVSQSSQFRTNIGVAEGAGEAATVRFSVFSNDGTLLGQWDEALQPGEQRQYDQIIGQKGLTLEGGRVEIEVVSDTGKVTAYASTVDNQTGDPTFITPVNRKSVPAESRLVIPGVADLDNGIASWRTDVRLYNAGESTETVTLVYYPQGSTEASASKQFTIAPGGVLEANDILKSTFGLSNSGGALHIQSDGSAKLVPTARTYNKVESGTYGQFIPAVSASKGARVGSPPLQLLQVEQSADFRTNVGFAELSGSSVTVEVTAAVPGTLIAPIKNYTLGPNEFQQVNAILGDMGISEAYNARVSIRVVGGGGSVSAYASVVDNETQDPTYVPAQ
jgi:hypothetical protein